MQKTLCLLVVSLLVGGCAIKPVPLDMQDIKERIEADRKAMYEGQEALTRPLTLWEALARGLKYNLDHRVKLMENALAERILATHNKELLPDLVANAGYHWRDNYSGGVSQSLVDGEISLEPSTSESLNYQEYGLTFAWNFLDFGVNHAIAHQKAEDILITRERRRRVIQNIMVDIYKAYWRAVGASRLLPRVEKLLNDTKKVLAESKQIEAEALQNPEIPLLYRKQLLESVRSLSKVREEMILARSQLAALINISMHQDYEVAIPDDYQMAPELNVPLTKLEEIALTRQPEILEEDYTKRKDIWEVKKALRRMLPGIEISFGPHYNSNDFLYHNSWYSASLNISWNLINAFTTGPAAKREAEAHVALDDHRRMALSMAVLAQVWVSYLRYELAREDFILADELFQVNSRLSELMEKAVQANTRSEKDAVLRRAQTLSANMDRELAFADMHTALARVFHSVGTDPIPRWLIDEAPYSFAKHDVSTLAKLIAEYNRARLSGTARLDCSEKEMQNSATVCFF